MQACFIGHRNILKTEELKIVLRKTVIALINKGVTAFLFGSMSNFDDLAWEVVTELKKEHVGVKRIYVRATYPYLEKAYEQYLLERYEETYFPSRIKDAGKYSYVERNYEMIDKSTYCVFYYNEAYIPSLTKSAKRTSGTKIAYKYAVKNRKKIINLY